MRGLPRGQGSVDLRTWPGLRLSFSQNLGMDGDAEIDRILARTAELARLAEMHAELAARLQLGITAVAA